MIIVSQPCLIGNCNCNVFDGADEKVVGFPPFHEGCTCCVVEEKENG
jgi:hypothetical protein